jgi:hypothetical protein
MLGYYLVKKTVFKDGKSYFLQLDDSIFNLNWHQCFFFFQTIRFLGFVVASTSI